MRRLSSRATSGIAAAAAVAAVATESIKSVAWEKNERIIYGTRLGRDKI